MKWLVQLIVGIFKALLGSPIEEKERTTDVGRKQPEDPDNAFSDSDW